jgi:hypothetical protein
MRTGLIPITFALAALGCGASDQDVREAQMSGYRGDFAVVYTETLAAVRDLYPQLTEDARAGIIKTAWHPVHVQQGTDDSAKHVNTPGARTGFSATTALRQQYFIRFDVHVVGGKPWRVRVRGEASSWKAGEIPTPLHGAEVPHWLEGRVNGLEVAIHERLKKYAVELKFKPGSEAAPAAAVAPIDTAKYGAVPPAAAKVIAEVERTAVARDVARLRQFMAADFTYNFGDAPSADTAIVVWQADPSVLGELVKALGAGCAHDPTGAQVVCPASFLKDVESPGYRVSFRQVGGSWKMVSFVNGD